MVRPVVRILSALLISMLLMSLTARGQTLLPVLVDASGNFQQVETTAESSEDAESDATPADDEGKEEQAPSDGQGPSEPEKPAKPPLSTETAAFRDQVRRTLSQVYSRSLNAQSNLPTEIMSMAKRWLDSGRT